ncbi:trypsin-like serine peptidase [Chthonobacter albigriseus]|uniref:trypsin-like serine peptidase n=1 Tax=Chthonobacter albigriseus TaxID=1683161 RepID=UPI0015EEDFAD|nr:trypsin-like peptidase domain-containing protein [Chthonobacter albigriseus]
MRLTFGFLACLLAGLGSAIAAEGVIGRDDRVATEPDVWPLMTVGRLVFKTGGFCTATLVAPDAILMARHCIPKAKGQSGPPRARLTLFVAGYSKGRHKGTAEGQSYVLGSDHPTAIPATMQGGGLASSFDDWALVKVTSYDGSLNGIEPAVPFEGDLSDLVNKPIMLAGYHHDRPSVLSVQKNCRVLGVAPGTPLFLHDCDLKGRASGSPIFIGDGKDTRLIGIALAYSKLADGSTVGIGRAVPALNP